MTNLPNHQLGQMETTCESLLNELQVIWDEIGESDPEKDRMLLELERDCLEVYRKKVDQSNRRRAQLRQAIADSEAELATICSSMGERPVHMRQSIQNAGGLREELSAIIPELEEMKKRKAERWNQFLEVIEQIKKISAEIGQTEFLPSNFSLNKSDLSLRKLEELTKQLQALQKEKSDRLTRVFEQLNTLSTLCEVLGLDYKETVSEIHPSLSENEGGSNKLISDDIIAKLECSIEKLREVKIQRMQKLQELATTMIELWNLMDTPIEEQQLFRNVTCKIAASEHEITEPNTLSLDFISYVEAEVERLEQFKASKMKELVLKKKTELEEHRQRAHLIGEGDSDSECPLQAIEAGAIDASLVLEQIEAQIALLKEEAFSRKDILERVEKWMTACQEESWLEEYNKDENRYNAGRGAHLTLKRAEKARNLVNKIPAMVDNLAAKISLWENEMGRSFTYDGVRLLSMLEDYNILRQEKEHERKRQRDQKKLQGQLIAEQEALYGSKPSPSKTPGPKKVTKASNGATNRRLSLGGAMIQAPKTDVSTRAVRAYKKVDEIGALLSPGSRGLDIAGNNPAKKLVFNTTTDISRETELIRKPLTLVTLKNHVVPQSTPASVPWDETTDEENIVPKTISVLKTPLVKVCDAMQMANTPAKSALCFDNETVKELKVCDGAEFETSVEERRLALYISR